VKELEEILRARTRMQGPLVLATVVAVAGSAYRRPGARMVMGNEGWLAGGVSGGCLEGDIIRKAFFWTAEGPRLLRYDSTGDNADEEDALSFALGCNGVVAVLALTKTGEALAADPRLTRVAEFDPGRTPLSTTCDSRANVP